MKSDVLVRTMHKPDAHARDLSREVLSAIRRISHAVHQYSCQLERDYGLTGPQLVILEEIALHDKIAVTELARSISLSQATVTGVLQRLEKQELVTRVRGMQDKRTTVLSITEKGSLLLKDAPPLLQEAFVMGFSGLPSWEQLTILSSLHHIVHLMETEEKALSSCNSIKTSKFVGGRGKNESEPIEKNRESIFR